MDNLADHMIGLTALEAQLLAFYEKKAREASPPDSKDYEKAAHSLRNKKDD